MRLPMSKAAKNLPRMNRMMSVAGVDPFELAQAVRGTTYAQAVRRCASCQHGEACDAWLTQPHEPGATPPEFCANSTYFGTR